MTAPVSVSPWHRGELEAQRRAGVDPSHTATVSGFMRPFLNEQHQGFYPQLPFIVVGVVDHRGRPWATLLEGRPGFMKADDDRHLRIAAATDDADPVASALACDSAIGLLGIELQSRRRNRLNGRISRVRDDEFTVEVDRAYGNCPQYIHTRELRFHESSRNDPAGVDRLGTLDDEARQAIADSDTFFVASAAEEPTRAVDVSHRGGRRGFVDVHDDWLTIPDFQGNQFFNTLGNFLVNPKAGLIFPDFLTGDVLQLTGTVEVLFDNPGMAAFDGAQRLWRFHVEEMVRRRGVSHWRGDVHDESAEAERTGTWAEAHARQRSAATQGWREFRVERVTDEATDVRSFTLRPLAGALDETHAGMHLVLRLPEVVDRPAIIVSYSLSRMPMDGSYRISVKRGGASSRAVWSYLREGGVVELRGPQGEFFADLASPRPAVLLSAGIGITPMLAMAEEIVEADRRTGRRRRVHFLHGARNGESMPFRAELAALRSEAGGVLTVTRCFSQPLQADQQGRDFEFKGRLDVRTLRKTLAFDDYDFYLCGPTDFMQKTYDDLRSMNIADDRIRAEAFGPSSLRRATEHDAAMSSQARKPASVSTPVAFVRAGKVVDWTPGSGSLLELAERSGLHPEFGCRNGTCGTCRTTVVGGAVAYIGLPPAAVKHDAALICCAVPAAPRSDDVAQLLQLEL